MRLVFKGARRNLLGAILGGCLVVGVLPALAADQGVAVANFSFTPSSVAVMPGETVTWTNGGSTANHSVHFDGEPALNAPAMMFTDMKTFPDAGEFHYHCDVHASMTGTVFVNATGTVPPMPTPSPTPSPTPAPTTAPPAATPIPTVITPPVTLTARAAHASFCTRRSSKCKHPGVVLSLKLGAHASVHVTGTLRRRPLKGGSLRRFGIVAFSAVPGSHQVRLPVHRRLTPGRYELELKAAGLTRRLHFRVRAA